MRARASEQEEDGHRPGNHGGTRRQATAHFLDPAPIKAHSGCAAPQAGRPVPVRARCWLFHVALTQPRRTGLRAPVWTQLMRAATF